jgi:hypothetical protein
MYTCCNVIRFFIRGTFDWQFIFELESDVRVRLIVRMGPGARATAQRSREEGLEESQAQITLRNMGSPSCSMHGRLATYPHSVLCPEGFPLKMGGGKDW